MLKVKTKAIQDHSLGFGVELVCLYSTESLEVGRVAVKPSSRGGRSVLKTGLKV